MSWGNTNLSPIRKDQVSDILVSDQTDPDGCGPAFQEQLEAALHVADILADVVGGPDSLVVVSIGGHANPDHASDHEGWSDETIHVSVSVAK